MERRTWFQFYFHSIASEHIQKYKLAHAWWNEMTLIALLFFSQVWIRLISDPEWMWIDDDRFFSYSLATISIYIDSKWNLWFFFIASIASVISVVFFYFVYTYSLKEVIKLNHVSLASSPPPPPPPFIERGKKWQWSQQKWQWSQQKNIP